MPFYSKILNSYVLINATIKRRKIPMKLMFASDLHGSAYYGRKMLEIYEKSGASQLIFLGDILYHGPRNDLP